MDNAQEVCHCNAQAHFKLKDILPFPSVKLSMPVIKMAELWREMWNRKMSVFWDVVLALWLKFTNVSDVLGASNMTAVSVPDVGCSKHI
jgi:hypothetical protein